jgi:hypothetical protein
LIIRKIKGEITTQQIILLIILLVSFIVILFFLFKINLGKESDSEICHNSVAMRANPISKDAVPLKCSRAYICLTKDGDCAQMTKPEIIKVETKEEIYNALAKQMANCWWMFGEGKIDYVTDTMTKNNYCSICSQILFDDSLKKIEGVGNEISQDELYDYLSKTKMPDEDYTYAYYLLGTNNVRMIKSELSNQAGKDVTFGTITVGKQYFVVMGITSEVNTLGWVIRGAAVGGALVVGAATFGIGTAGFVAIAVGEGVGVGGGIGGAKLSDIISPRISGITVEGKGVKNHFMVPTIQEASSQEFKLLNCEDILTST